MLATLRTFSPTGLNTVLEPLVCGPGEVVEVTGAVVDGARLAVVGDELCPLVLHAAAVPVISAAPASRRPKRHATLLEPIVDATAALPLG